MTIPWARTTSWSHHTANTRFAQKCAAEHRVEYPEDKTQQNTDADSKVEASVESKAEANKGPENNGETPSSDEPANSEPTKQ